jgi:hypothetical protein
VVTIDPPEGLLDAAPKPRGAKGER